MTVHQLETMSLLEYCSFDGGPMVSLDPRTRRPLERLLESHFDAADAPVADAAPALDPSEFRDSEAAVAAYLKQIAKICGDTTKSTTQQLRAIEPLLAAVKRVRAELRTAAEDSPAEMTSESFAHRLLHGDDKPSRQETLHFVESLTGGRRRGNRAEYHPL